MNTYQTTQENPIPLIKPQPPLPILIKETTFKYEYSEVFKKNIFRIKAGLISLIYLDIFFDEYKLLNGTTVFKKDEFITSKLNEEEEALLSIWIDRCKGVSL